jgi:uncharacterized protein (UPF0335 family)
MKNKNPDLKIKLKSYVKNIERVDAQIGALLETRNEYHLEAGREGINIRALDRLLSQRKNEKDPATREFMEISELYRQALEE